jgi:HEAT repeat protein
VLLGELKDPRAVPALIPLLEEPEVNFGAVFALEEIGGQQAVTALIKRLSDLDPSIRVLAIRALAHLHSKEAVPAIYRLLNDEDSSHVDDLVSVGEAAREALVQLGADPGQ